MIRNSILYRRLTYIKKRNTVNIHIISKLTFVIIIFLLILTYVQKFIIPQLALVSQIKAQEAFYASVDSVISDTYVKNIIFNSLFTSSVDMEGNIKYIQLDSFKIKRLSIELSNLIDNKLKSMNLTEIRQPFGTFTGINALSKLGPIIHIRYSPFRKVETTVTSNLSGDIGKQKSIILKLKIKSGISIKHPFSEKYLEFSTDVPIKQTIVLK